MLRMIVLSVVFAAHVLASASTQPIDFSVERHCSLSEGTKHPSFISLVGTSVRQRDSATFSLNQLLDGTTQIYINGLRPRDHFFFYDMVIPVDGVPLHYQLRTAANWYFSGLTNIEVEPIDSSDSQIDFKIFPTYSQATNSTAKNKDDLSIVFSCIK